MIKSRIYNMLKAEAAADLEKAKLSFELLTENPTGTGDHATRDFWNNCREALDMLTDASDRLDMIEALEVAAINSIEKTSIDTC